MAVQSAVAVSSRCADSAFAAGYGLELRSIVTMQDLTVDHRDRAVAELVCLTSTNASIMLIDYEVHCCI